MGEKSRGNFAPAQKISQERFDQIFKKDPPSKSDSICYEVSLCIEGHCHKKVMCSNCPFQIVEKKVNNKNW